MFAYYNTTSFSARNHVLIWWPLVKKHRKINYSFLCPPQMLLCQASKQRKMLFSWHLNFEKENRTGKKVYNLDRSKHINYQYNLNLTERKAAFKLCIALNPRQGTWFVHDPLCYKVYCWFCSWRAFNLRINSAQCLILVKKCCGLALPPCINDPLILRFLALHDLSLLGIYVWLTLPREISSKSVCHSYTCTGTSVEKLLETTLHNKPICTQMSHTEEVSLSYRNLSISLMSFCPIPPGSTAVVYAMAERLKPSSVVTFDKSPVVSHSSPLLLWQQYYNASQLPMYYFSRGFLHPQQLREGSLILRSLSIGQVWTTDDWTTP